MPINTGQTSPWTTTEIATDLASVSIYHGIARSDGTIKRRVYLGCKVDSWELEISESGTIATLSLQITGSTPQGNQFDSSSDPTSGTFPVPTDSQMPTTGTTGPYVFAHASGGLLIGSARTQFDAVKIKSTNVLAKRFWASRFLGMARLVGRHTTLEATNFYTPTPDDRTSYEGIVGLTTGGGYTGTDASFTLNNGTHTVVIDLKNNSVFTAIEDKTPLEDLYMQTTVSQTSMIRRAYDRFHRRVHLRSDISRAYRSGQRLFTLRRFSRTDYPGQPVAMGRLGCGHGQGRYKNPRSLSAVRRADSSLPIFQARWRVVRESARD